MTVSSRELDSHGDSFYKILNMKSKEVVQRRVDLLAEEGIESCCFHGTGKTLPAKNMEEFDAVVLYGATKPVDLVLQKKEEPQGCIMRWNLLPAHPRSSWSS